MKNIEVTLSKDRKGRPVKVLIMPVDDSTEVKVVQASGRTVILNMKELRAQFWFPGTPDDRHYEPIRLRPDLDEKK